MKVNGWSYVLLVIVISLLAFIFGTWALGVAFLGFDGAEAFSMGLLYLGLLFVVFLVASLIVGVCTVALFIHKNNMSIPLLIVALVFFIFMCAGIVKMMLGGGALVDIPELVKTVFLL